MDNFIQIIKEKMNHFSFHSNYTPSSKKWSYIIPLLVVLILSIVTYLFFVRYLFLFKCCILPNFATFQVGMLAAFQL